MPRRAAASVEATRHHRPALTPEAREGQLIALAMDLAQQRLRDGTASSQEVTHFLKLGCMREKLEQDIMRQKRELMETQRKAIQSQARIEELYADALNAMKRYSGMDDGGA